MPSAVDPTTARATHSTTCPVAVSPIRWACSERCPSGRRSATGNRVGAERCLEGSNPSLSAAAARRYSAAMPPESPFVELEVGARTVKVTNPDKVFFATRGETKLDLVQYYLSVGDGIVRTLYERPTQLKRHPDGAEGEAIYQKRVPEKRPGWIETATVRFPSGRHADELCVTEVAHVAWAANLGTIVFHPWPSRRADTEHPDEMRIDLDPQPGTDFDDARAVAVVVHELLDELGYAGYPKTSGNRGIHIAGRIEPLWKFPEVRPC